MLKKNIICIVMMAMLLPQMSVLAKAEEDANVIEEITLLDYTAETTFIDVDEIEQIVKAYQLEDSGCIEELRYIPFEKAEVGNMENEKSIKKEGLKEYYIKRQECSDKESELIRSSWYNAPSGSMGIIESDLIMCIFPNSASVTGGINTIEAMLKDVRGFGTSRNMKISQDISVKTGYKRNCKAYAIYRGYDFEVWEDDVLKDDYVGKGTVKEPIGIIFTLGENISCREY